MSNQFLHRCIQIGILAILVLAPTQWGFEVRPKTFVSPVDPLVAVTAGFALLAALRGRLVRRVDAPSPFALLLVVFGLISISGAGDRMAAVKDVVQWVLYFVVVWMLFRYGLEDPWSRRWGLVVAGCAGIAVLVAATVQFFRPEVPDLGVRGFFGNRNVLGGFLALMLPFAFAQSLVRVKPMAALAGVLITLLGIGVTLSGSAALAILLALLAMAAVQSRFATAWTLSFVLFVVVVVHPNLPRRDDVTDPWLDSIALHDSNAALSRRYPDWESAWLMAQENPWRGVGAGNYQAKISGFRRIPTRTGAPEPDTQNLYLVLASSIGLPGLLVFLALLLEGLSSSLRTAQDAARACPADRALALGAFGGLLAYAITAIWHPLLVRGIGIPLVAVLVLAQHLHSRANRAANG